LVHHVTSRLLKVKTARLQDYNLDQGLPNKQYKGNSVDSNNRCDIYRTIGTRNWIACQKWPVSRPRIEPGTCQLLSVLMWPSIVQTVEKGQICADRCRRLGPDCAVTYLDTTRKDRRGPQNHILALIWSGDIHKQQPEQPRAASSW
jgi:hypothetical protein